MEVIKAINYIYKLLLKYQVWKKDKAKKKNYKYYINIKYYMDALSRLPQKRETGQEKDARIEILAWPILVLESTKKP